MNFNFTGTLGLNDIKSKHPFLRKGKTSAGDDYLSLSLSIIAAKNNRAFVELFGMQRTSINTVDSEGNKIEISWADRFDEDVVESVARYRKFVVNNGTERREFLTEWDMINYIVENADDFTGKKVTCTGRTSKNIYNGEATTRFTLQNLYIVDDDTKNKLTVTAPVYWTADDIDTADWKATKKLIINGYTSDYVSDKAAGLKGNYYFPQAVVFDASKIDETNDKHVALKNYKLKQVGLVDEDGKIKSKLKSGKVYTLGLTMAYVNGAEEVPFDESALTPNQLSAIELGIKTIDDFRPAGQTYGERKVEYKLVDFDLRGLAEDGAYDSEISTSEFEESKFVASKTESIDDVVAKANASAAAADDDDDLFG